MRYAGTISLLILISVITGCYAPITGRVIDAETNNPIEGAMVLVEWTREVGIGDHRTDSVKVVETMTDKDGGFEASRPIAFFDDPPDVTVYKKGYVAWNNKWIFPDYKHRQKTNDMYQTIKLEYYEQSYSHNKHISFIRTCINDVLVMQNKKKFIAAYEWEIDLAREEVLREK